MGIIREIFEGIVALICLIAVSISLILYFILGLIVIGLPVSVVFIIIFPFLGGWAVIPGFLATILFFIVILSD